MRRRLHTTNSHRIGYNNKVTDKPIPTLECRGDTSLQASPAITVSPIYFQVVVGVSPSEAGVRNLPLLISYSVGSGRAGVLISLFSHYILLMLWANAGGCVASATKSSPDLLTGLAFRSPFIAGHANTKPEDLASATAMLLSHPTSLGAGQSMLSNLPLTKLPSVVPTVEPSSAIATGATEIRHVFPADAISGIGGSS
ncbi:hypothetical protein BBP40_001541 [Aspergillus hancockii]|nr:hypothetical protein BBP40_001541 [Aspergillus hancockii]